MKLLKETQSKDLKRKTKLPKSEVERHRRERMNQSLESLRALLLKGQHRPGLASGRVEKAEILEHTVLFLRNAEGTVPRGSELQHFEDGFSACLRQAARFLKVEGEAREAGSALTAALSSCRLRPLAHDAAAAWLSACPPWTRLEEPPVPARQQGWKCGQRPCRAIADHDLPRRRAPLAHTDPSNAQRLLRNTPTPLCSSPVTHSLALWRPWS